jgi:anhydro-N-acetylmuramic acid kinase
MIKNYCNKLLTTNRYINILTKEEVGFSSEAKEAVAFVVLAYQTMKGRLIMFLRLPELKGRLF